MAVDCLPRPPLLTQNKSALRPQLKPCLSTTIRRYGVYVSLLILTFAYSSVHKTNNSGFDLL